MTRAPHRLSGAVAGIALTVAGLAAALAGTAHGQAGTDLTIRRVDTTEPGVVRLSVVVTGRVGEAAFIVRENGQPVPNVTVRPTAQTATPVATVLTIDTSGSMARRLAAAQAAAKGFVDRTLDNETVAVVSFDNAVRVVTGFTSDRALLYQAIDTLRAAGETALRDAVVASAAL
ncbi:MAG: VWA domain-containing protein [Acidimicrobiales bacterium]